MRLDFDINMKKLERDLGDIGKKAIPRAISGFLNGMAFQAQKNLVGHLDEAFDGHVRFTERSWFVTKAKPSQGDQMASEVVTYPKQAAYLQFQIYGGQRRTGDAGSGPYDLMVFGSKTNKAGNIRWGYPRQLAKQNREEKAARADWKRRKKPYLERAAWDWSGDYGAAHFATFTAHFKKPGIFFGEVNGVKGYWQRPARTKAPKNAKRKRGVVRVRTKGNSKLTPLLTVSEFARYKPIFRYSQQIENAVSSASSMQRFVEELQYHMSRL